MKILPMIKKILKNPPTILIASILIANVANMLFNAYMGRVLSLDDFGAITFLLTIDYLAIVIFNAIGGVVNQRTAFLSARFNAPTSLAYAKYIQQKTFPLVLAVSFVWLLATPFLSPFFHIENPMLLLSFTLMLVPGLLIAINRGYLLGSLHFSFVAFTLLSESIIRLLAGVILVALGFESLVYLTIPFSLLVGFFVSKHFIPHIKIDNDHNFTFPFAFLGAVLLSGLSSMSYLTFDVMLVKHYMSPENAGVYAILSLVGKMIYFFGSMINVLTGTYISRDLGLKKNPHHTFHLILGGVSLLSFMGFVALGVFGQYLVPLIFGAKSLSIVPFLFPYSLSIVLLTISATIISFHLAQQRYIFPLVSLAISAFLVIGITLFHNSIGDITQVMLTVSSINLLLMVILHAVTGRGRFFVRNVLDFLGAFFPLPKIPVTKHKKKILIFNWRDTKHHFAGGAEVYIHELAKRWVKVGHHVTLFCGNDSLSRRYEMVDGIEVIRRGGFYTVYLWAFLYYILRFRGRYDVILDSQNGIPFFTPLYAKERVICLMHHVHQDVFMRSLSWPLSHLAAYLEKRVMPWAYRQTKFIAISKSTKDTMQKIGLGREGTQIVEPGLELTQYRVGIKAKQPLLLYMGRLKKYKGIYEFIKIAKQLVQQIPTVRVVIAGDGEEFDQVKKLITDLRLSTKIKLLGRVSEEEKRALYQKAWVFVNPSFVEGWGITSIEANASGTSVVASRVAGLQDSVKNPHTGYLVTYGDIEEFVKKITVLIKNTKLRKSMEKEAILWARNFDWQKSAQKGLRVMMSS